MFPSRCRTLTCSECRPAEPDAARCVVLFYWEDQSVFDIAHALGGLESTVKQHLFRARARLADLLGEEVSGDVR